MPLGGELSTRPRRAPSGRPAPFADELHDFPMAKTKVDSLDVQGGASTDIRTQDEGLTIATPNPHRAVAACPIQDIGELLPGFRIGEFLHGETSKSSTPDLTATWASPRSKVSRGAR